VYLLQQKILHETLLLVFLSCNTGNYQLQIFKIFQAVLQPDSVISVKTHTVQVWFIRLICICYCLMSDGVAWMRVYDIPVYFLSSRCSNWTAISKEAIADAVHTCDALAVKLSDVHVLRLFWTTCTEVEWVNRCLSNRRRLNLI
jgi:hypothetical protein